MTKVSVLCNNLNSGELSQLIESRSDLAKYAAGCKTLQNAFALVEGGAKKMPGTYFAGIAANGGPLGTPSSGKSRLVSFQFSEDQNAILEFFQYGIRFWIDGGLVVSGTSGDLDWNPTTSYVLGQQCLVGTYLINSWTSGTNLIVQAPYGQFVPPNTLVITETNSSDTLSVAVGGVVGSQYIVVNLANTTPAHNSQANIQAAIRALGFLNSPQSNYVDLSAWEVAWEPYGATPEIVFSNESTGHPTVVANAFQSLTGSNIGNFPPLYPADWEVAPASGIPVVVTTPYLEADLFALDVSTQSADVLYICHSSYPPATLNRYSDTNWIYTPISTSGVPSSNPGVGQLYGTTDVVTTGYSALGQNISLISQTTDCTVVIASSSASQPFTNGARIYINECAGMVELNQGQFLVENIAYGSVSISVTDSSGTVSSIPATGWYFNIQDPDTGLLVNSTSYLQYAGGGFAVAIPALFCGAGNYPACVTLYQQRLCLAGATNNPTQMSGSVQDDYPDFICDPNENNYAIQFTLVSQQVNPIRWMIGSPNALLLGTAGGVWAMYTVDGNALSQNDVTAAVQSTIGTGNVAPQLVNSDVIWITRSGLVVRLFLFNFLTNQWEGPDLTRLNREITIGPTEATSGIVQTAFQKELYPILWAVRADGQLLGMTYERSEQVFAWCRIVTNGIIESVACVSQDGAEDQVWIVVNRTINGASQRYVEYFMPQEIYGQLSNAFFVHAGLQWNGGPAATVTGITQASPAVVTAANHGFSTGQSVAISGVNGMVAPNGQPINTGPASAYVVTVVDANHFSLNGMNTTAFTAYASGGTTMQVTNTVTGMEYLAGETVQAVGDGAKIYQGTVPASGTVVLGSYANLITIGLPYQTIIEPMNPVIGQAQSTSKSHKQKFSRANLSLYQSIGGKFGTDMAHLHAVPYGTGSKGLPPSLFTGNVLFDLDADWTDEGTVTIFHEEPFPFCVRSIVPRLSIAEEG